MAPDPTANIQLALHPFRFLVRLFLSVSLILLLLIVLWFLWSGIAQRRLKRQIEAFNRLGNTSVIDKAESADPFPDSENAAVAWRAAMAATSTTVWSPRQGNLTYKPYPPFAPQWWTDATASEQANAAAFLLAHQSARLHRARWLPASSATQFPPGWLSLIPFNQARSLANTLADSALFNHLQHQDGVAVERIVDILQIADALKQHDDEVSRLVSIGIQKLAYEDIFIIAPDLDVGSRSDAQRQQVCWTIAHLMSRSTVADRTRTLISEQQHAIETTAVAKAASELLGPLVDLSAARGVQRLTLDVRAGLEPDAAAAAQLYVDDQIVKKVQSVSGLEFSWHFNRQIYANAPKIKPKLRISRMFDELTSSSAPRLIGIEWSQTSAAHAAATALAIRMFRTDHNGQWPAKISDLIPDDLAATPSDDLAAGSPPIEYAIRPNGLPDGSDRPMLFYGRRDVPPELIVVPNEPQISDSGSKLSSFWIDLKCWPQSTASTAPSQ